MLRFAADDFWKASQVMAEWRLNLPKPLSPSNALQVQHTLRQLVTHLRGLNLPVSVREFEKLEALMKQEVADIGALPVASQEERYSNVTTALSTRLEQIASVVHSELESRAFMSIPSDRFAFYEPRELFASEVCARFPELLYDIAEAGTCYAVARGTACVFHLMRIMEVGVQAFGRKLGITFTDQKNWQCILDQANKVIKDLPSRDATTVKLCAVSANLYSVKLAWRNEVMHPKQTYTLEEAHDLLMQVKLFMSNLAGLI